MKRSTLFTLCSALVLSHGVQATDGDISTYIYNGTTTTAETWPSIAAIYYDAIKYSGVYGQYCGSTILDATHVMTAAHCLYDGSGNLNEEYLVYTSVVPQLTNSSEFIAGTVEVIRPVNFYVNAGYIDSPSAASVPWPNDIAIIELASPMNVLSATDYVIRATALQSLMYRIVDQPFIAVGYGKTETNTSGQLLWTQLTYEPTTSCSLGAGDSQLCMKGVYNSTTGVRNSTCSGDSGGPLYWYNGTNYVQAGITSYGWTNCYNAGSQDTAVFTEVADYSDWINSVLSHSVTPVFTVTDAIRDAYTPTVGVDDGVTPPENSSPDKATSSGGGGGSLSYTVLILLALLGFCRRKRLTA